MNNWTQTQAQTNPWLKPSKSMPYLCEKWHNEKYFNILDVGSGFGRNAIYLAKNNFNVTAIEIDDYALNYSKNNAIEQNAKVDFLKYDVNNLPFDDCSFDAIVCTSVIFNHNLNECNHILDQLYRVLKNGGELFLTLQSQNSSNFINTNDKQFVDECTLKIDTNNNHINELYFNYDNLLKVIDKFKLTEQVEETIVYDFENNKNYTGHYILYLKK